MNNLTITGNIGKDAEINETNGKKVINFNVAVNESYTKDGVKVEKTLWVRCAYWRADGKSVEIAKYLKSGKKVLVSGSAKPEAYKDEDGEAIPTQGLTVEKLELLSPKE